MSGPGDEEGDLGGNGEGRERGDDEGVRGAAKAEELREENAGERTEDDVLADGREEIAIEAGGEERGGGGADDEEEQHAGEIADDRAGELLQAAERERRDAA